MRKADELIHGLEAESEEFACVAEAAGDALKGASLTELSQHQLHEFEQFLKLHDPHESWKSQLVRVVLQSGSVLWVSPEGKKKVDLLELRVRLYPLRVRLNDTFFGMECLQGHSLAQNHMRRRYHVMNTRSR